MWGFGFDGPYLRLKSLAGVSKGSDEQDAQGELLRLSPFLWSLNRPALYHLQRRVSLPIA